ncbi:hypothetical protein TREES_T100014755 [Tupaia chinensis]|uniref:Uncharacterized protein n=1 Tax=Tupaia chinensis TaxID=246437 RepID=L9KZR4_TUPCH|nr:hypothetical protein TREES_T100014755 [Tupaia chinensis]
MSRTMEGSQAGRAGIGNRSRWPKLRQAGQPAKGTEDAHGREPVSVRATASPDRKPDSSARHVPAVRQAHAEVAYGQCRYTGRDTALPTLSKTLRTMRWEQYRIPARAGGDRMALFGLLKLPCKCLLAGGLGQAPCSRPYTLSNPNQHSDLSLAVAALQNRGPAPSQYRHPEGSCSLLDTRADPSIIRLLPYFAPDVKEVHLDYSV